MLISIRIGMKEQGQLSRLCLGSYLKHLSVHLEEGL